MKSKNKRQNFSKFTSRASRKRTSKERSRNEIMRALDAVSVQYENAKIKSSSDRGRRARQSSKVRREELVAEGTFSSSKSGFGFVTVEGRQSDVFIPEGKTQGAIDGDLVEIIYHSYKNSFGEEKTEGRVAKILKFGRKSIIGTVERKRRYGRGGGYAFFVNPDDQRLPVYPEITNAPSDLHEFDKVEAKLIRKSLYKTECEVIKSFGEAESKEANYAAVLAECEIEVDFSREEEKEAEFFAALPIDSEGRDDKRGEIIFTIDGEGAKDLDDAISLKKTRDGCSLGVHIADVSYYVRERTHLDRAVMRRGTSVYFTDKVVPMLPPSLSNGACSLGAGEDKYALSAEINLSREGEILDLKLTPSIIKSRVRGVYSEVNSIFDGTSDEKIKEKYREVIPTLNEMRELYFTLCEKSKARGSIELDSPEAEIVLDESGAPKEIVKRERGDAERMIEQFMLTANEAVARALNEKGIPCVYRVHEAPPPDKLDLFIDYVHNLGFDTSFISRESCEPKSFANLLKAADGKGLSLPVSYTMLRSMAKAKYSDRCDGHFGLGIEKYCHFTSPIRRLSDLATHRIIRRVLFEGKEQKLLASYARRAAAAASEAELRALAAERKIENLYKVIYMQDRIGEEFDAIINSVTAFGFFCMPENTCEGLVPITELGYGFVFDEKTLTLRRGEERYRLGDRVRVRLAEADIIRGKLRYDCIGLI